mgnify:CR=1 FL=1
MIIPKRILGSLLGKRIKVIFSSNPKLIGKEGIITFETRNMIEIMLEDNRRIFIPKRNSIFEIQFDDKTKIIIDGVILARRMRLLRRLGRRR